MNKTTRNALAPFALSLLAVGCAGTPAQPELKPVQVVQASDPALACPELMTEISTMESAVARLRAEADNAKSSARTFDIANSLGQSFGNYNPFNSSLNSIMAGFNREKADLKRETLDSYQRRRDTLMQQYHHKGCAQS